MEPMFIIFTVLAILLIIAIMYEALEIRKYNQSWEEVTQAIQEIVTTMNNNIEIQRSDRLLQRETVVDVAMMKTLLEIHGNRIGVPIPKDQWDELMTAVKDLAK